MTAAPVAAAAAPPGAAAPRVRSHGNAYEIFILVLTVMSLIVMALVILPLSPATHETLLWFDNAICFVFLADFVYNITGSRPRREYFIHRGGWLDLLGSIPTLGFFRFTALFRLARLSRLARIMRLLSGQHKRELIEDIVRNRGQYALFVSLLLVFIVLTTGTVLVLQFESRSPDANIVTGGDALWWAFVTLTTVGYGDFFPVTTLGRATGVAVMAAGIGLIGALASILASILVPSPDEQAAAATAAGSDDKAALDQRLATIQDELAAIREELRAIRGSAGDPVEAGPPPESR
jgi:voltage-gated potassium channel